MRRISKNAYTEIYFWGCNPSFVVTTDGVVMFDSPQQPIDAVRWRETMLAHGPIRYLINTEPHGDHISGNQYFPGTEVVGQVGLQARYADGVKSFWSAERKETMKTADPDSVWLIDHPDYPPNPPTKTFTDQLTLHLGNHTFNLINLPGHTKPQTAIHVPEEGVVFTGDNIFYKCRTFLQEADPWEWLDSLNKIRAFDAAVIVPGHGETCDASYLKEQANIIEDWIGLAEGYVNRGLSEDEAIKASLEETVDPYPMAQRLHPMTDRLNGVNMRNLHRHVLAKQGAAAPA